MRFVLEISGFQKAAERILPWMQCFDVERFCEEAFADLNELSYQVHHYIRTDDERVIVPTKLYNATKYIVRQYDSQVTPNDMFEISGAVVVVLQELIDKLSLMGDVWTNYEYSFVRADDSRGPDSLKHIRVTYRECKVRDMDNSRRNRNDVNRATLMILDGLSGETESYLSNYNPRLGRY